MKRREMILETDWYTDCDDVVAARILCNLHRCKAVKLLGASINAWFPDSVRSLDGFLRDHGVDVPVAIVRDFKADVRPVSTYQSHLVKYLPSKYGSNDEAEDPVRLYRRLLANSQGQIEILSIGFTQNLARLLQSPPDALSPLSGLELVKEKVSELWIMAGRWDQEPGLEYNFSGEEGTDNHCIAQSAAVVCGQWPTPVTFLGFEVGVSVISGNELPADDLLKQAMIAHGSADGRSSWDPMLVMLAAAGSPEAAGYSEVRGRATADPATGQNTFVKDPAGPHRYVVKVHPDSFYQQQLNQAMEKYAIPLVKRDEPLEIFNYGSLNIDLVYTLPHFVLPGETISCCRFDRNPGGKGLNQSIALARAGARVCHGCNVGEDGDFLVETLREAGVDTAKIRRCAGPSGHAIIEVEENSGSNRIILFPGANRSHTKDEIVQLLAQTKPGNFMLLQNENNLTDFAVSEALRHDLNIVFNPAPCDEAACKMPIECMKTCIVNEVEAGQLTGLPLDSTPEALAEAFLAKYPTTELIITLGADGVFFAGGTSTRIRVNAVKAQAVDTTAAGDTFVGYYLAASFRGFSPKKALEYAAKASAITVSRPGAAKSIPLAEEVF